MRLIFWAYYRDATPNSLLEILMCLKLKCLSLEPKNKSPNNSNTGKQLIYRAWNNARIAGSNNLNNGEPLSIDLLIINQKCEKQHIPGEEGMKLFHKY